MIFPWPSRKLRQEAIMNARREKEQSRLGAAQAADLQAQVRQAAGSRRPVTGGRTQLQVMLADPMPSGRMDCPVLQSGKLADCPVFLSGRLAD